MNKDLKPIINKCELAGIKTQVIPRRIGSVEFHDLTFTFPQGKQKREIKVAAEYYIEEMDSARNIAFLERVEKSKFEKFCLLPDYEAIWSQELGIVESSVVIVQSRFNRFIHHIHGTGEIDTIFDGLKNNDRIEIPIGHNNLLVTLGKSSDAFSVLFSNFSCREERDLGQTTTLRVQGLNANNESSARKQMLEIMNAVLFQVDLMKGVSMYPTPQISENYVQPDIEEDHLRQELNPTKYIYDNEAMALYWYARQSMSFPLLQYLAYYQVLEFYFPRYTRKDAHKAVLNVVKNPTFNVDRLSDVSKLLSAIGDSAWGQRNERGQLRATFENSLLISELREYLAEDKNREQFFASDDAKSLVKPNLSMRSTDENLFNSLVERVYNLRCRIVHTKEEGFDFKPLFPFSSEIGNMQYDIELLRFIAIRVISVSGEAIESKYYDENA